MSPSYSIYRCRSCKVQVQWEQRDRLSYGWYHGYPGEGCEYGQYLNPEHVEQMVAWVSSGQVETPLIEPNQQDSSE